MNTITGKAAVLLCLAILALFAAGCSRNAYLERNVDYVSDDLLIEQEEVLKNDLTKAKAIYDDALRSGETMAIEGAKEQYADYQDKYGIVVEELKSRFGKNDWEQAVASRRANTAAAPKPDQGAAQAPAKGVEAVEREVDQAVNMENTDTVVFAPPKSFQNHPARQEPAQAAPVQAAPVQAEPVQAEPQQTAPAAPVAPAVSSASASGASGSYVVARGDSLSSIASRFKVSGQAIMAANGMTDPDKLAAGQTLVIPGMDQPLPESEPAVSPDAGAGAAEASAAAPAKPDAPESYVVKKGDSLKAIAIRYGVNSKTIMELNGMTDPDKLAAGQTLRLR